MQVSPQSLSDRLQEEGGRVIDFFKRLTPEQREAQIYHGDDCWSMHQLLAHFVSAEIGRNELVFSIARGGEGAPPGFDIDTFNQNEVARLSAETDQLLLDVFSHERTSLADLVSSLKGEDLERVGNDPYLGPAPLKEIIKLTYLHLQIHLRDARKCL